jgi:LEA14-like dessication related protein
MSLRKIICLFLILSAFVSCKKERIFLEPGVEIISYSLTEFPGEYLHLNITVEITNNDDRQPNINEVEYQVFIEGLTSEPEIFVVDTIFRTDEPLELTLPLTFKTDEALELVDQLEVGQELSYQVVGSISFNDPILKLFTIPVDVSGTAIVDMGFDEFYEEPTVLLSDIQIDYKIIDWTSYQFIINTSCLVDNPNPFDVTIDEVVYTVKVENVLSETNRYSDSHDEAFLMEKDAVSKLELPVVINLELIEALDLIEAISDGFISYWVEGVLHVSAVNGVAMDLNVPFELAGEY